MRSVSQHATPPHASGDARQPYVAPQLMRWGDFAALTRGSTGGTSDGNMTGVSETFQFVPTGDWHLDDE